MYQGTTPTKFGQKPVAARLDPLRLHLCTVHPEELHSVDWEPPIPVLDQEDFAAQGIDTSTVVPGAPKVDALGCCTADGGMAALSQLLGLNAFAGAATTILGRTVDPTSSALVQEAAIVTYHRTTDLTGDPAEEWPPTDCGSNESCVATFLEQLQLVGTTLTASSIMSLLQLLQVRGVAVGGPWFNSWMQPDRKGFVDGDGSQAALKAAVASGVAGGHERFISSIEVIVLDRNGQVDLQKTVLRERNSWSKNWGDGGSYRTHASTHALLARYEDWRQFQPKAA